ncbi:MAG: twin-arginine translocation signal domain-containing protein [Thermomicrobiales bacterium]
MDLNEQRFDVLAHSVSGVPSRRRLLGALTAAGAGLGLTQLPKSADARRKEKPRKRKGLCKKNGTACTRPNKTCQKRYCLNAPFTIAAVWTQSRDHDTYFFVPPQDEATGPSSYIRFSCNPDNSFCEETYPFACVSQDAPGPGDEITTIHQFLPGTYEYWINLYKTTPAGEVTVALKDSNDRVVRQWTSPANPADTKLGWHVFDIDGRDGRVTAIDALHDDDPPSINYPSTNVCPKPA